MISGETARAKTELEDRSSAPVLDMFPVDAAMGEGLKAISRLATGTFTLARFANNDLYLTLDSSPTGQNALVLGSIAPPETELVAFLLLCHTLKKEGARTVTA